jgi:glycosyltransferase involved in cell wall biosynthesis
MPELPELPPIAREPLSVVLLASNAEGCVRQVLAGWLRVLQERGSEFEILLVDDGSSDRTPALAEEEAATVPALKILRHDQPRGIGAALRTGLTACTRPLIVCAPCDPAYRAEDLPRFLAEIDRVHLLTGYRAGRRGPLVLRPLGLLFRLIHLLLFSHAPRRLPGWLGWRGHLGNLLARIFFGVRLRDVACPFRMFRREILPRCPLQSEGEFVWVEQLAKVNFAGWIFGEEIPLAVAPRGTRGLWRLLREAYHVFTRPDFGPASVRAVNP